MALIQGATTGKQQGTRRQQKLHADGTKVHANSTKALAGSKNALSDRLSEWLIQRIMSVTRRKLVMTFLVALVIFATLLPTFAQDQQLSGFEGGAVGSPSLLNRMQN